MSEKVITNATQQSLFQENIGYDKAGMPIHTDSSTTQANAAVSVTINNQFDALGRMRQVQRSVSQGSQRAHQYQPLHF